MGKIRWSAMAVVMGAVVSISVSSNGFASPTPKYQGDFQVRPQVVHSGPISGKMTLIFDGAAFTQVKLALDQPVFGQSALQSSEQWLGNMGTGAASQTAAVFKLKGSPHRWYFVLISSSTDGWITQQGTIYRADVSMGEIQNTVKNPVNETPANWKPVGTATLKAL